MTKRCEYFFEIKFWRRESFIAVWFSKLTLIERIKIYDNIIMIVTFLTIKDAIFSSNCFQNRSYLRLYRTLSFPSQHTSLTNQDLNCLLSSVQKIIFFSSLNVATTLENIPGSFREDSTHNCRKSSFDKIFEDDSESNCFDSGVFSKVMS